MKQSIQRIRSCSTAINRLPTWTDKLLNQMEEPSVFLFKMTTATAPLARLKAGFLLKHILDIFTRKTESNLVPDRTFFMYSGHDENIVNILNGMGIFDVIVDNILYEFRILISVFLIFSRNFRRLLLVLCLNFTNWTKSIL